MKDTVRQTDDKSTGLITDFLDLFTSLVLSIDFTNNVRNIQQLKMFTEFQQILVQKGITFIS